MKKILFIANIPSPYRVDFFSKLGENIDLTVWFENEKVDYRQWKSSVADKKFRSKFFEFKNNNKIKNLLNIIKEFRKAKYDTYIVGGYSTPIGMMSIIYLKLTGKKFILNADGGFIKKDSKKNYLLKKMFISSADYWLSSGKNCTKYLVHYGAKEDRVFEYPFASIDYSSNDLLDLNEKQINQIKSAYKLNEIVVLSVGSFIEIKGLELLIKSFKNVQDKFKNLKISLVLVGGGELKEQYEQYIKENNIDNIVIIDFLGKEELIKFYKISDIFVFPSKGDVWGLVLNEAMSFGLPIISSSMAGATYDLMINEKNGFMFESENIEDLTNKLEILAKDSDIRNKFSKESKEIIKNYSIESMVKSHIDILKKII